MSTSAKPMMIDKEHVSQLEFPSSEVLQTREDIIKRKVDLERATTLGNLEQAKMKIIFEDSAGLKQIETTIWGVTDKRIILNSGMVIPIHRIHEVRI